MMSVLIFLFISIDSPALFYYYDGKWKLFMLRKVIFDFNLKMHLQSIFKFITVWMCLKSIFYLYGQGQVFNIWAADDE